MDQYEIKNGFVGMQRDVILKLTKFVETPAKIRAMIGVCVETYSWKEKDFFEKIRRDLFLWRSVNAVESVGDSFLVYKLVLAGDSEVGKTSLLSRYCKNEIETMVGPTIGVSFERKNVRFHKDEFQLQMWDTSGQSKYKAVTMGYFRGANGVLLVYDISKRDSFTNVVTWLKDVKERVSPSTVIMLVGNGSDKQNNREISRLEAKLFAQHNGLLFVETSALLGTDVDRAFSTVLVEMRKCGGKNSPVLVTNKEKENASPTVTTGDKSDKN